jgi:ribonuclease P protein component
MFPRLKKSPEFKRVAQAKNVSRCPSLIVQCAISPATSHAFRVGFTASRRVGGAVLRNRAKRRIRALTELYLPALIAEKELPFMDFVLIAVPATVTVDFPTLSAHFCRAIKHCILNAKH